MNATDEGAFAPKALVFVFLNKCQNVKFEDRRYWWIEEKNSSVSEAYLIFINFDSPPH